jgi:hypothetical protein
MSHTVSADRQRVTAALKFHTHCIIHRYLACSGIAVNFTSVLCGVYSLLFCKVDSTLILQIMSRKLLLLFYSRDDNTVNIYCCIYWHYFS